MAANYNKLWKLLIDKGMTKTDLRMKTGMSTSTLAKMSNNENVSMEVILRICEILECNVGDVMDATKKEAEKCGCHIVELNVWAFNESAVEFYKSCGMTVQRMYMEYVLD